ncbi:MAG: glycoside hydrolase family 88 protein [Paenibacillus lautus]|jgi:unsaturated chondroitin disaccharide hydrolase|uniref:glycoside hydrolase family 88 protein n=1 Tax=Paenibacillus lautus TaxID=1401 RepID=UPI0026EE82D5|nr:glycoside hydrolase family 88 protein [Paenibacillus lautus]MCI1777271.1 glycoside hydrolase family 88 protein [Paenibacillus lautus]
MWEQAIMDAVEKTKRNIGLFPMKFPHITAEKRYEWGESNDWIEGFYTGMIWLCYEYTKDPLFRDTAIAQLEDYKARLEEKRHLDHHDIGFLYLPSALASWIVDEHKEGKQLALKAADHLMLRWREEGQYIQAWGRKGDEKNGGRIIIDCMMNIPLLYWAYDQTGDESYKRVAVAHAEKSRRYLMRGDDSSYHTFYFQPSDGKPIGGGTHQGYHDGSTWTRGQAWAIYGFALSYRYTRDPKYLDTAVRAARYFIEHLPEDHVAYWDFDVPIEAGTPRDSSASAIAACGMLEILEHLEEEDGNKGLLTDAVEKSMISLVNHYSTIGEAAEEGLIKHGSYYVRGGIGPDDYMIWGDYYYLEALLRLTEGIPGYWYERG